MSEEDRAPAAELKKILIVEDDKIALHAMAQMVQTAGYTVIIAGDSGEAIRAFELEKPDLMLVDINLRGDNVGQPMDGLGLIDWLNYRHADHVFKYIIVSGDDPRAHEGRAALSGASAFIRKPIDPHSVLVEMKKAIGDLLEAGPSGSPAQEQE